MKTREIIGYIMVAIPVIALFVFIIYNLNLLLIPLCAIVAALLVLGWIALAAWLIG